MPAFELMDRYQTAVLWTKTGVDRYNEITYATPVEIKVRWDWVNTKSVDSQGEKIILDAKVVTDRDIVLGSLLWLGCLDDWYSDGSGSDDTRLMEAKTKSEDPDLKNRFNRKTIGLAKYRNKLPT